MDEFDLFGNAIIKDVIVRDKYIENPFSTIDTKTNAGEIEENNG